MSVYTPEQNQVIRDLYAHGMTSTKEKTCGQLISQAMDETGLTKEQVKTKIGNLRRAEGGKTTQSKAGSLVIKGPSGYNLFQSANVKVGPTAFREYGKAWHSLDDDEREEYNSRARKQHDRPDTDLNDEEKAQ